MERFNAGISYYWSLGRALDIGSVSILIVLLYLKTVREFIYMERLNAGILDHWSLGSVSEH